MKLSEVAAIIEGLSPYALQDIRRAPHMIMATIGNAPKGSRLSSITIALSETELQCAKFPRQIVEHHVRTAVQEMNRHLKDAA